VHQQEQHPTQDSDVQRAKIMPAAARHEVMEAPRGVVPDVKRHHQAAEPARQLLKGCKELTIENQLQHVMQLLLCTSTLWEREVLQCAQHLGLEERAASHKQVQPAHQHV